MKFLLAAYFLLPSITGFAQSPYLSVKLKMDSVFRGQFHYKIEMMICELKNPSKVGDWFTHDTSKVDFLSLKPGDIDCGEFFDKGLPTLISGEDKPQPLDEFEYGNQNMAFEKILVFKITDRSHRNWVQPMFVIMPVKIKSFNTYIELNNIIFHEDKVVFVDSTDCRIEGSKLFMNYSLRNATTMNVDDFPLFKK